MAQFSSNSFSVVIKPVTVTTGVPAWVPPPGYFADVPMLNNPVDVTPAIYLTDTFGLNSQFINWGGSAVLRDFSPLGAQVYYASGHESTPTTPNVQCALICDFTTLLWSVSNVPKAVNSVSKVNPTGIFPDGTPYTPHTYLGLQEFPTSWGGGKRGSLLQFFAAGAPYLNRINVLDVSAASNGFSQLNTQQPENVDPTKISFGNNSNFASTYPITVMDEQRQGWWAATTGSVPYTLFISKTGAIKQYPALGGNLASGALVLCAKLNLLIAIDGGYVSGTYANNGYRSLYIRDLASGATSTSLTSGAVPSIFDGYDGSVGTFRRPEAMGLQWVDELNCIVGLDQTSNPPSIVKLSPPASNVTTASWTWSIIPLQHWPKDTAGQSALQTSLNSAWSKFRWVPSLHAFVYGTAKDRKPQIIKIS